MIPFATPSDGEVINLTQVISVKHLEGGDAVVKFADGTTKQYVGQAAAIIHTEIAFNINAYRSYQKAATGQKGNIVAADGQRIL